MIEIGKFLVLLGLGSFALHFLNLEFRLLMWIDTWGIETGHAIRGGLALLGAALYFLGLRGLAPQDEDSLDDIQTRDQVPQS